MEHLQMSYAYFIHDSVYQKVSKLIGCLIKYPKVKLWTFLDTVCIGLRRSFNNVIIRPNSFTCSLHTWPKTFKSEYRQYNLQNCVNVCSFAFSPTKRPSIRNLALCLCPLRLRKLPMVLLQNFCQWRDRKHRTSQGDISNGTQKRAQHAFIDWLLGVSNCTIVRYKLFNKFNFKVSGNDWRKRENFLDTKNNDEVMKCCWHHRGISTLPSFISMMLSTCKSSMFYLYDAVYLYLLTVNQTLAEDCSDYRDGRLILNRTVGQRFTGKVFNNSNVR